MTKTKIIIVSISVILAVAIIISTTLFWCFTSGRSYKFQERTYSFSGEPYAISDGLFIEELSISFKKISLSQYKQANYVNTIRNKRNKFCYSVVLSIKFAGDTEPVQYNFTENPSSLYPYPPNKNSYPPNEYWIVFENADINANIRVLLTAKSLNYNSLKNCADKFDVIFVLNDAFNEVTQIPLSVM